MEGRLECDNLSFSIILSQQEEKRDKIKVRRRKIQLANERKERKEQGQDVEIMLECDVFHFPIILNQQEEALRQNG